MALDGKTARFVRLQRPTPTWFHLDVVEVYPTSDPKKNIALGKAAGQERRLIELRKRSAPLLAQRR